MLTSPNRIVLIAILLFLGKSNLPAQMSPFDGAYTVVIQLPDTWETSVGIFFLKAVAPLGDTCASYSSEVTRQFSDPNACLIKNRYNNKIWEARAKEYAKMANFFTPNHQAVVLNSHERYCVVQTSGQNKHVPRAFGLYVIKNEITTLIQMIPNHQIFSLSTYRGRWAEISPVMVE